MQHAFTHNPLDDRLYTTVTSMFRYSSLPHAHVDVNFLAVKSHRSFVHLVVSCSALTCFGV